MRPGPAPVKALEGVNVARGFVFQRPPLLFQSIQRRQIVRQIRDATRSLSEAERQIELRQAALEVAARTYDVEQSRFELGLADSQQLLQAQGDMTRARIDALAAIITYQRELKNVRGATMAELEELTP